MLQCATSCTALCVNVHKWGNQESYSKENGSMRDAADACLDRQYGPKHRYGFGELMRSMKLDLRFSPFDSLQIIWSKLKKKTSAYAYHNHPEQFVDA